MVLEIEEKEDFESKLMDANQHLVVVDFFATWSDECNNIAPRIQELANSHLNILFLKVDVDIGEEIAADYNITSMPTFILIKRKQVVARFIGADFDKLKAIIMQHI